MCDYRLGSKGYPQDFECINGVAIDIDNYMEGSWDMGFVGPAPCHTHYCVTCKGTGEVTEDGGAADCDDCSGTGYTNQINDSIERLTAHSQQDELCEVV